MADVTRGILSFAVEIPLAIPGMMEEVECLVHNREWYLILLVENGIFLLPGYSQQKWVVS